MAEQMLTGFAEDGWLAQHALRCWPTGSSSAPITAEITRE